MRVNSAAAALRIAHLIESDVPGGAEQVVVHLATSLQASGAQSVVFVPANGEGWLARQLEGSGVAVEHFDLNGPLSPACARQVAAALRRHDVQIAHSHEFSMAVYGGWASCLAGIPHVIAAYTGEDVAPDGPPVSLDIAARRRTRARASPSVTIASSSPETAEGRR